MIVEVHHNDAMSTFSLVAIRILLETAVPNLYSLFSNLILINPQRLLSSALPALLDSAPISVPIISLSQLQNTHKSNAQVV